MRYLTDRRFLGALIIMIVNDHVLKPWLGAGRFGLITGKLSDFAAPIVGAALVAGALTIRPFSPVVSENARRLIAIAAPSLLLIAIKLSETGAGAYEATLAALTGYSFRVVVDPTDLIGLAVLPIMWQLVTAPRPAIVFGHLPDARRVAAFLLGLTAAFFTVANSVSDGRASDKVDEVDGTLYAYNSHRDGLTYLSTDDGLTWEPRTDQLQPALDGSREPVRYHCLRARPDHCVRIVGDVRAEESFDGGQTWRHAWALAEHHEQIPDGTYGADGYGRVRLTDILETSNGTIIVAATAIDPIRSAELGVWQPTLAELRPFPVGSLAVVGGLLFLVIPLGTLIRHGTGGAYARRSDLKIGLMIVLALPFIFMGLPTLVFVLVVAPIAVILGAGPARRKTLAQNLVAGLVVLAITAAPLAVWSAGYGRLDHARMAAAILAFVLSVVVVFGAPRTFTRVDSLPQPGAGYGPSDEPSRP